MATAKNTDRKGGLRVAGDPLLGAVYRHWYLDVRQAAKAVLKPQGYSSLSSERVRKIQDETKRRLAILTDDGLLERVMFKDPEKGGNRTLWVATPKGQKEAAAGWGHRYNSYPTVDGIRAVGWKHTHSVNETGLALANGLDGFDWQCWTHEVSLPLGAGRTDGREYLRPDAVVSYEDAEGKLQSMFLELDRGTEKIHQLADKVWNYHRYYNYAPKRAKGDSRPERDWEERFPFGFPSLIFVWAHVDPSVGWRRTISLSAAMGEDRRYDAAEFRVSAGMLVHLYEMGPYSETLVDLQTQELHTWMKPPPPEENPEGSAPDPPHAEDADLLPPMR